MQQSQDNLSTMPAFMSMKLIGTAFRGVLPAMIIATTAAAGGLIYGAVKAGKGINKYAQKTKAGNNKGSKLLRDIDAQSLVYSKGHEKAGQPIPTSELVSYYKVPERFYNDFEKAAKKMGLPYSRVDYAVGNGDKMQSEIMVMKKHDGIVKNIMSNMAQAQEKAWKLEQSDINSFNASAGRPVFLEDVPDFKAEVQKEMQIPKDAASLHEVAGIISTKVVADVCEQMRMASILSGGKLSKEDKKAAADIVKNPEKIMSEISKKGALKAADTGYRFKQNIDISAIQKELNIQAYGKPSKPLRTSQNETSKTQKGPESVDNKAVTQVARAVTLRKNQLSEDESKELNDMAQGLFRSAVLGIREDTQGVPKLHEDKEALEKMNDLLNSAGYPGYFVADRGIDDNKIPSLSFIGNVEDKSKFMEMTSAISKNLSGPEIKNKIIPLLGSDDPKINREAAALLVREETKAFDAVNATDKAAQKGDKRDDLSNNTASAIAHKKDMTSATKSGPKR